MTHTAITPLLGRQFDRFLFASVGEDRNGTALSVLSALARFDVDPWQEAVILARMPRETATERMTAVIAAATIDFAASPSPATTSARLIALLPQTPTYKSAAPLALVKASARARWRIFVMPAVVALLCAAYFIFATHRSPGGDTNLAPTTIKAEVIR